MISLNPFKKKDDSGFSLDEHSLPSLSDMNGNSNTPQNNAPPIQENSNDLSQPPQPSFNDNSTQVPTPDFSNPFSQTSSTMHPQDLSKESNVENQPSNQNSNQSYHNDYSKAKLDSIDAKVALLDAKFSSIEQKMDALISMISEEVSDETKAKLKLNSMIDSIKQNNK